MGACPVRCLNEVLEHLKQYSIHSVKRPGSSHWFDHESTRSMHFASASLGLHTVIPEGTSLSPTVAQLSLWIAPICKHVINCQHLQGAELLARSVCSCIPPPRSKAASASFLITAPCRLSFVASRRRMDCAVR